MKRLLPMLWAAALHAAPVGETPPERIEAEETEAPTVCDTGPWLTWSHATGGWLGQRNRLLVHGVDLFGGLSLEAWSNPLGGVRRGTTANVLFNFGLEIDLEAFAGWHGATLHHSWFAPLGHDLSGLYVGNHFTVSNAVAWTSLYLYELWFEQEAGPLSLRIGQLAADTEFATSDHGALFLNSAFGWPPFLSGNLPNVGPAFPKGTPGARLAVAPAQWLTLQSAVFQGNPYADPENPSGTRWHLGGSNGWLWLHEVQLRWSPPGRPGQLKLGGWHHTARFPDLAAPQHLHHGNFGFYGVVDQTLWRPDPDGKAGLGWFARAGGSPADRNLFAFYGDTGLTWRGLFATREDDTLGLAVAWGRLSSGAQAAKAPRDEMALELTYQCQLTPWLTLQPDVQWLILPGATDALVLGLRAAVVF